jgi:hypothetical protein
MIPIHVERHFLLRDVIWGHRGVAIRGFEGRDTVHAVSVVTHIVLEKV